MMRNNSGGPERVSTGLTVYYRLSIINGAPAAGIHRDVAMLTGPIEIT
jgi:hypothetical protein